MNPVNPNGPLHGVSPVHTEEQQENETQQNNQTPLQDSHEQQNSDSTITKKHKIKKRKKYSFGFNLVPLLVASSLAIRPMLFPNLQMFVPMGLYAGVASFIATRSIKKSVFKIKERKKGTDLTSDERKKCNIAILCSALGLGLITIASKAMIEGIPVDSILTIAVAVGAGITNLCHKIAFNVNKKIEEYKTAKSK